MEEAEEEKSRRPAVDTIYPSPEHKKKKKKKKKKTILNDPVMCFQGCLPI